MSASTPNTSQRSNSSFSSHERRVIYGDIVSAVQTVAEDTNTNTEQRLRKLGEIVKRVELEAPSGNNNDGSSKETYDYYLHSKVLKNTSEVTVRCVELVTSEVDNYDKFELAAHIADNSDYWNFTFPNEVPVFSYLFGTFEPTPPEARPRAPRRRVERKRAGDLKAPQKIDKIEKKDEQSAMIEQVRRFVGKACRSGPVSYFHIVLDPNCFTRTVENIYHLSFLVKEGLVAVSLDVNTGLPFVRPMDGQKRQRSEGSEENQFIVSMDMQRWKELTQAFDIRTPMMVLKRK